MKNAHLVWTLLISEVLRGYFENSTEFDNFRLNI
jgi:hypothetical protein